jgi:hypothetical protein
MATTNDSTQLSGLFKPVFESEVVELFPSIDIIQKKLGKSDFEQLGDKYWIPLQLAVEQGFTYQASSGESGAPSLNASVAGNVQFLQVPSYQIILRSRISYGTLSKAASKGPEAVQQSYGYTVGSMKASMKKRVELSLLQGQRALGKVTGNSSGVLTLDSTTWAPGIWAGQVGMVLEAWTAETATATQHNGDLTITKVDVPNKQITVSGTNGSVINGDYLYAKGARTSTAFNEGPGLMALVKTTSGTLFNLANVDNYDTFQAQQLTITGNLSFSNLMQLDMATVNYGMNVDKSVFVAPRVWAEIATDQAALRREDSSYSKTKATRGSKAVEFESGSGATLELIAHPYMRENEAGMFAFDEIRLVGSTLPTFGLPGIGSLEVQVTDTGAVEIRQFSDVSPVILQPALCGYISGIT